MSAALKFSPNSIGKYRTVFIFGDPVIAKEIQSLLAPLPNLLFKSVSEIHVDPAKLCFLITVCDFEQVANMQLVAKSLSQYDSSTVHKIIFSMSKKNLDQQHLLFSIELGAKFTAFGPNRDFKLKDYLKRLVMGDDLNDDLEAIAYDLETYFLKRDDIGLKKVADKLLRCPKDNEDVLRLQAVACQHLRLATKSAYYLRKILSINPQNLWAANELGRLYLRSNRVAEGVEVLGKLSQFHDLNSERSLHLGDAYLGAGKLKNAESEYRKGRDLVGQASGDGRFKEGLAKIKVAEGDMQSALSLLDKPVLSENVLGFINMRAVMAIRSGQIEAGIRFYQLALDGCPDDKIVRSKLLFNMGLAFVKIRDNENAVRSFENSANLGGAEFSRALKPLEIAKKSLHRQRMVDERERCDKNDDDLVEIDLEE